MSPGSHSAGLRHFCALWAGERSGQRAFLLNDRLGRNPYSVCVCVKPPLERGDMPVTYVTLVPQQLLNDRIAYHACSLAPGSHVWTERYGKIADQNAIFRIV